MYEGKVGSHRGTRKHAGRHEVHARAWKVIFLIIPLMFYGMSFLPHGNALIVASALSGVGYLAYRFGHHTGGSHGALGHGRTEPVFIRPTVRGPRSMEETSEYPIMTVVPDLRAVPEDEPPVEEPGRTAKHLSLVPPVESAIPQEASYGITSPSPFQINRLASALGTTLSVYYGVRTFYRAYEHQVHSGQAWERNTAPFSTPGSWSAQG